MCVHKTSGLKVAGKTLSQTTCYKSLLMLSIRLPTFVIWKGLGHRWHLWWTRLYTSQV